MGQTVSKGLHILEALALSSRPRGVTELAGELGLVKSNVHRLLKVLERHRFVRKNDASGGYECTLKLWELGSLVAERVDVRRAAAPAMATLAEQTLETVHLSVLDGAEVLYIDKIDSAQPVRAYTRVGGRAPAYCVATGKALLAFEPKAKIEALSSELTRFTPRTLTDMDALKKELADIRELGYAINRGEWRDSVCGLAAPILSASRRPVAALGISGPIDRLRPGVLRDLAPVVVEGARAVSRELGFSDFSVQPSKSSA